MDSFKAFVEHTDFVDHILNEFNGVPSTQAQGAPMTQQAAVQPAQKMKLWSAKKPEIMQMWQNLRADTPIIMTPLADKKPGEKEHSTYGEDGIRITGSWNFISAVLSRLKEIVAYENPQNKLRLVFRGIDKMRASRPDRDSYVFYANLERRDFGKPGRPKKNTFTQAPPAI
jgi:hypothetical protein